MEFGGFILAQQRGHHQSSSQIIRNSIEQTVAAETAGFDTARHAEHDLNNCSLSGSALMMAVHRAGPAKTIRKGTYVCILPCEHFGVDLKNSRELRPRPATSQRQPAQSELSHAGSRPPHSPPCP